MNLIIKSLGMMTCSKMTHNIKTLSILSFSMKTFFITELSIALNNALLRVESNQL